MTVRYSVQIGEAKSICGTHVYTYGQESKWIWIWKNPLPRLHLPHLGEAVLPNVSPKRF
jgi:hypothetical protein